MSSPIGELPFEPTRVTVGRGGIEIEGRMGAWPAHVHLDHADVPRLLRLVPRPAVAGAGALAATLLLRRRRRRAT